MCESGHHAVYPNQPAEVVPRRRKASVVLLASPRHSVTRTNHDRPTDYIRMWTYSSFHQKSRGSETDIAVCAVSRSVWLAQCVLAQPVRETSATPACEDGARIFRGMPLYSVGEPRFREWGAAVGVGREARVKKDAAHNPLALPPFSCSPTHRRRVIRSGGLAGDLGTIFWSIGIRICERWWQCWCKGS